MGKGVVFLSKEPDSGVGSNQGMESAVVRSEDTVLQIGTNSGGLQFLPVWRHFRGSQRLHRIPLEGLWNHS